MRGATARWFPILACLLLAAACGTTTASPTGSRAATTAGPTAPVRVTLGIFSGRPDPSWFLADAEATALDAALTTLAGAMGEPPVGGLGYRGFTIERTDGPLIAFEGAIGRLGEGRRAYLADPARTIERLLLGTARAHVAGNVLAEVERSLATP